MPAAVSFSHIIERNSKFTVTKLVYLQLYLSLFSTGIFELITDLDSKLQSRVVILKCHLSLGLLPSPPTWLITSLLFLLEPLTGPSPKVRHAANLIILILRL